MKLYPFSPICPLLFLGIILFNAGEVLAQVVGQVRPAGAIQTPGNTGGFGGGAVGGGGSTSSSSTRQYVNSTMVGDAMITSDMDTRRIIVVTDDVTNESIKTVLAGLDKPKPQVLINVVFLQVEHDKDLDLGAEATYKGSIAVSTKPTGTATSAFGIAAAEALPTTYGGFYSILGKDVNATIHLLATTNRTQVLSRPSILTRSGQQATVMVGQSIPIVTNSQVSSVTNAITNTVTYQDIGIILKVTPFITAEGNVEMIVSPQTSSLSATTVPISTGVNSPVIDKTQADTVVVTPSDKTVVIGGLISSQKTTTEDKIPFLGDIPLLGHLFKHSVDGAKKSELLIFLTPHVVNNPEDLSRLAESERGRLELTPKSTEKDELGKYIGNH